MDQSGPCLGLSPLDLRKETCQTSNWSRFERQFSFQFVTLLYVLSCLENSFETLTVFPYLSIAPSNIQNSVTDLLDLHHHLLLLSKPVLLIYLVRFMFNTKI